VRPHAAPVPVVQASAAGSPVAAASSATLVVAVGGRVRRPGLVRLAAGARVADAIEAAGGALPGTDLSLVNLARKVVDGELIVIGITPPPGAAPVPSGQAPAGGAVNLNTATLAELQTLPGIGAVLAQRILDYRTAHGEFRSVNELRQVDGIGDAKFAQLKDRVTV
jgi:competence protein ComEA